MGKEFLANEPKLGNENDGQGNEERKCWDITILAVSPLEGEDILLSSENLHTRAVTDRGKEL